MNVYSTIKKSSLILFTFCIIVTWQTPLYNMWRLQITVPKAPDAKPAGGNDGKAATTLSRSDVKEAFSSSAALERPRKYDPIRPASHEEVRAMTEAIERADHGALDTIISPGEFNIDDVRVQHIMRDRAENGFLLVNKSTRRVDDTEPLLWHAVGYFLAETDEDVVDKRLKIVDLLLYHYANPNQPAWFFHDGKKFRCHLLHVAVLTNKTDLAGLLKSYQADPGFTDQFGKTPAQYLDTSRRSILLAAILGVVTHAALTAGEHAVEHAVTGAVTAATHDKKKKPAKPTATRACSRSTCCL